MKSFRVYMLLFAMSLLLVIVGCSEGDSGKEANESANDSKAELDYPKKPVKVLVPWAAGGGSDVFVRVLSELGSDYIGESIVVENKEGAGGTVGLAEAVKQSPDGYNLVASSAGLFSTHPHLREVQYNLDDIIPIIGLQNSPQIYVVNADSPYDSLEELLEGVKSNNETIKYAAPGALSVGDIAMKTLFSKNEVNAELVPYQGHAPAVAALLGNHVDAAVVFPADVVSHVEDGNVKILGTFTSERLDDLPDVPTVAEQGLLEGLEDHSFESWFFLGAPKDTPQEIIDYLNEGFSELMKDPKVIKYTEDAIQPIRPESSEEVMERLTNEIEIYNELIPELDSN